MSAPSPITTHVLNTATGSPAANLQIKLYRVTLSADHETLNLINSGSVISSGQSCLTFQQYTSH